MAVTKRSKFRIGDRIRYTKESWASEFGEFDEISGFDYIGDPITKEGGCWYESHLAKICEIVSRRADEKNTEVRQQTPQFILQYELESDPFELIYSEKELRTRIAELAEKPELKRDSIKVYDIKRVRTVKLGVKITISK